MKLNPLALSQNKLWKWGIASAAILLYLLLTTAYAANLRGAIGGLSALPVLIIAGLFGLRGGVLSGLALGLLSSWIMTLAQVNTLPQASLYVVGATLGMLTGGVVGYFSDRYKVLPQAEQTFSTRVQEQTQENPQLLIQLLSKSITQLQQEMVAHTAARAELQTSLHEKDLLLKEVHHRVKNNMQVIVSLLSLQAATLTDEATRSLFNDSQNRVRSMALVHEKLYQSNNLAQIDLRDYLQHLATNVFHSYSPRSNQIDLKVNVAEVIMGIDQAIPCGLITNELISNALKHGFPHNAPGEVTVSLRQLPTGQLELTVADNGVGLPVEKDWRQAETLGMQLVQSLVKQLKGTLELTRLDPGTKFTVQFNEPTH